MTYADPVELIRHAITQTTGQATHRVLNPDFTTGPMPIIHVHHTDGTADDIDRVDTIGVDVYHHTPTAPTDNSAPRIASRIRDALAVCGITTGAGLIDEVSVRAEPVTRPYFETVEVASMVLDVTHRPTD